MDRSALLELDKTQLRTVLTEAGLDRASIDHALTTHRSLQDLHATGKPIDTLNELHLFTRGVAQKDLDALAKQGIDTFREWALQRPTKTPKKAAERLDAFARFSAISTDPDDKQKLIDKGNISSLYQLSQLSKKELIKLARKTGVEKRQVFKAAILAQRQTKATEQMIIAAKSPGAANPDPEVGLGGDDSFPGNAPGLDLDDFILKCTPCPDQISIFSCLAYLIYLIQITRKTLFDLKELTNLDFPNLNADIIGELVQNPRVPCEQITLCQQMIRALQDLLNNLQVDNDNSSDPLDFSYLPFQTWKSTKMAVTYPELNALWRGDILTGETGSLSHGSFLQEPQQTRAHLMTELTSVEHALNEARVFPLGSTQFGYEVFPTPDQFNDADLFKDAHPDQYRTFLNGLDVIRQLLNADQAITESQKMLDIDDAGNSIFLLQQAIHHLDRTAELTFSPTSTWRNFSLSLDDSYLGLISSPPSKRHETQEQLFQELMEDVKPLFTPINQDISITGLSNDGSISLTSGWINRGFGNADGKLQKFRVSGQNSFVRYSQSGEDFSRFTNYKVSADLTLDEPMEDGEIIALAVRWHPDANPVLPKKGYMLAVTQSSESFDGGGFFSDGLGDAIEDFFGEEEDTTYTRQFLTLFEVSEASNGEVEFNLIGTPALIATHATGGGALNNPDRPLLQVDQAYPMSLQITGNQIKGELWANDELISVSGSDSSYSSGTFGFFGTEDTRFTFDNIHFEIEAADNGTPPFHVTTRNDRNQLDQQRYVEHRNSGAGMPTDALADFILTGTTTRRTVSRLNIKRVDNTSSQEQFVGLMYDENASFIRLDLLDRLLEKCLAATFYLRFAVIPVKLAQSFMLQGHYPQAIAHLKLLYDDHMPFESLREIYPYLTQTVNIFTPIVGADQMLIRLRLGEAYLKQAEQLFRQNTPESRHEALLLFERALALHNENDRCHCDERLGDVVEMVLRNVFDIDGITSKPDYSQFIDLIASIYQNNDVVNTGDILLKHLNENLSHNTFKKALKRTETEIDKIRSQHHQMIGKQTTIAQLSLTSQKLIEEAEVQTHRVDKGLLAGILSQTNRLRKALNLISIPFVDYLDVSLCIPQNPYVLAQTKQACLMLDLLENCLNILGYKDDFIPAHRFEYLFALANGFTDSAYNTERDVLNFRQLLEQDVQQYLQAENNVVLDQTNVSLEALNVEYAMGDIKLLELQKSQTEFSRDHYDQLITNGLSGYEELALGAATASTVFSGLAAAGGLISAGVAAVGTAKSATGNPIGIAMAVAGIAGTVLGGAQGVANFASSVSSLASMQASFERREEEWQYNLGLNQNGVDIAEQNLQQGLKRLDIVQRQHDIAQLRLGLARDTLSYLENKFLNKEMLVWMLRISREQYRLRLDYAISASFMAERALSFGLLSPATQMIRFDYFEPEVDGLLGATQLQTDLQALQATKLHSEKRKLQLQKTLSLAQIAPAELQKFKSAGILPFSTLLHWFDRDFPGHYQRTIKRISVSMLALVPPHEGIKAMLRNTGVSNLVIGPPYSQGFEKTTVLRNPESIALTSAIDDSGIIRFDYQDEFLLPFEGLGVETDWLLEMPRASNPLDFETIADIFVNVEYTALHSDVYAEVVRNQLGDTDQNDLPIVFRIHYPDQWYHFHNNPLDDHGQRHLEIDLYPHQLPPHYDKSQPISVPHLAVMLRGDFSGLNTNQRTQLKNCVTVEHLYVNGGNTPSLIVSGTSSSGVTHFRVNEIGDNKQTLLLSTRDGNDASVRLPGHIAVTGNWKVLVKDTLNGGLSLGGLIEDVLMVVTTEGKVAR